MHWEKNHSCAHHIPCFLPYAASQKRGSQIIEHYLTILLKGRCWKPFVALPLQGLALGNERFEEEVESLTGRSDSEKEGEACRLEKEGGNELMFSLPQLFYVSCKIKVLLRSF